MLDRKAESREVLIAGLGDPPIVVDIGGEGRYRRAWNVNPRRFKTLGPERGQPIPRHISGRAEAIPLPDQCADVVIAERTPLRIPALDEIARLVADSGLVILRHARIPGRDIHRSAKQIIVGFRTQSITRLGTQRVQESIFWTGTNVQQYQHLLTTLGESRHV